MRFTFRGAALGAVGLVAPLVTPVLVAGQLALGTADLTDCVVAPASVEALCGSVRVPEDRSAPGGRTLDLSVIVLPARGEAVGDPVFPLHGGPGAAARYLVPAFASHPLRASRDFVFVDQRGTGESNPLHCEPDDLGALLEVVLSFKIPSDVCLDNAADPTLYGTSIAMDDLDQIRAALGYERINLWGGSYGTRAALEFMRRHPDRVRTVLLDGLAPPFMYIPLYFPPGAEAALDLVLEDCVADEGCRTRFPDSRAQLARVLERLDARPAAIEVVDPRNGTPTSLTFGRQDMAAAVLYALYNSFTAARLPTWIHDAHGGDLGAIANFAVSFSVGIASQFSFGMTMAVACPEDAARYDLDDADRVADGSFLGSALALNFLDACADWPLATIEPGYWAPVASDLPVLVFSGEGDPVTPPHWAEWALQTLPNARHAVFPDQGHGASSTRCGTSLFRQFVERGTAEGLDLACAAGNRRPPWG